MCIYLFLGSGINIVPPTLIQPAENMKCPTSSVVLPAEIGNFSASTSKALSNAVYLTLQEPNKNHTEMDAKANATIFPISLFRDKIFNLN